MYKVFLLNQKRDPNCQNATGEKLLKMLKSLEWFLNKKYMDTPLS